MSHKILIPLMMISLTTLAKDYNMLTLGDSLSHGVFAKTGMLKTVESSNWKNWLIDKLLASPEYVYSDGDNINSIKTRLQGTGYIVNSIRYAKAGDETKDLLLRQVKQAVDSKIKFDGTFVLIGPNDLCAGVDVKTAVKNVMWSLAILQKLSVKVYLVGLPPIYNLNRIAKDKRNIWFMKAPKVWKLHGMCGRLTTNGEKNYELNKAWVNEFNLGLKEMSDGNAVYVEATTKEESFGWESISNWDIFHINRFGHEKLADLVWPYVL